MSLQSRRKYKWNSIQYTPSMGGGYRAGTGIAENLDHPDRSLAFEKCFGREHIEDGYAQKEISILKHLNHPNITKIRDHYVNEAEKRAAVYIEYCDMGTLADVHAQTNVGERVHEHKIWKWFIQIMEALVYCHRGPEPGNETMAREWQRVYHLGVQPGNIFLKQVRVNGEMRIVAKLGNFARSYGQKREHKDEAPNRAVLAMDPMLGFDPPEQQAISKSTDVWQLALTIVCICGLQGAPRSKQNPSGVKWDWDRPAGQVYSSELSSILKSFLDEDVKRRPGTYDSLKKLKQAYDRVRHKLPSDPARLELYDPRFSHEPPSIDQLPFVPPRKPRNRSPERGHARDRRPDVFMDMRGMGDDFLFDRGHFPPGW